MSDTYPNIFQQYAHNHNFMLATIISTNAKQSCFHHAKNVMIDSKFGFV